MLHRLDVPPHPSANRACFACWLLLALGVPSLSATAQDLYRLRIEGPSEVAPGSTVDVSVVADHLSFGSNGGALQAVQFRLLAPEGMSFTDPSVGADWSSDGVLFQSIEQLEPSAVRLVAIFRSPLPEMASRQLLALKLAVPPSAAGSILLAFDDSGGVGLDSRALFSTPQRGWVIPHLSERSMVISSSAPATPGAPPEEWPSPSEEELVIQYATVGDATLPTSNPLSSPEGGGMAMGGGPPEDLFCQYEPRGSLTEIPPFVDPADVLVVTAPGTIADIQAAFDVAKVSPDPVMIRVEAGIYAGSQLLLDVTGMANEVIIASFEGPVYKPAVDNGTTLQFPSVNPPAWAVRVIGTPSVGAVLNFGWTTMVEQSLNPPDYLTDDAYNRGWRGFELVGYRGGISIEAACPVRVRGNYLHHATGSGGNSGIFAGNFADIEVFHNEISQWSNSGIFIQYVVSNATVAKIIRNFIHDNRGADGGGIRAIGQNVEMCNNSIYSNRATSFDSQGGGVYYQFTPDFSYSRRFFARQNIVEENSANESGGGMFVQGVYNISKETAPMPEPWNFAIIGNQFRLNGLPAPGVGYVETGGGLHLSVELPANSDGLFEAYPGHEDQLIIGNTFLGNSAGLWGAGVVVSAQDPALVFPYLVRFEHNTIASNEVVTPPIPSLFWGTGFSLFDCCQYVTGDGVVIQDNLPDPVTPPPSTDDYNWYALFSSVNLFTYSRMPDCSPIPSPGDLLGTPASNPTSNSVEAEFSDLFGHQAPTSTSTLEDADPVLEALYLANPFLDEDFDRENRVDGTMDIGADEFIYPTSFQRGDADGNASLNIADAIRILEALFGIGQPPLDCESAGDANDDEQLNIADPVYLLGYLFTQGPAPPPPHPTCGIDPTDGSLTCQVTPCP